MRILLYPIFPFPFLRKLWKRLFHKDDLKRLAEAWIFPTYTDAYYRYLANRLFRELDSFGTNENEINAVFKELENDADFIKLDQAFGFRCTMGRPHIDCLNSENMDYWINAGCSKTEINYINHLLKTKEITKRF